MLSRKPVVPSEEYRAGGLPCRQSCAGQELSVKTVMLRKERFQPSLDDLCSAGSLRLQIDRDDRIMQGHADQHPALNFVIVKADTDPLVVGRDNVESRVLLCKCLEVRKDLLSILCEIIAFYGVTDLCGFGRCAERADEILDTAPFRAELSSLADDLYAEVCAVVGEIVLLQSAVPACLDRQRAVDAGRVQLDPLIDHILVASLESEMLHPEILLEEDGKLVAGDRVGDDCCAGILLL